MPILKDKLTQQRRVLTVSALTQDIKLILENTMTEVWVEGEVSNFKAYPSGHFYFTLKDEKAALQAVIFGAAFNKEIKFKLEDGLKVICFGRVSVYGPRSQYQIRVEQIEPKGLGQLQIAFEQLKEKLYKEGLFDERYKKPIPLLPLKIGVVTSVKGAAIRDILTILKRRAPFVSVIIRPVKVQGEGAKEEISQAIEDFNNYAKTGKRIDVLIVGRGGGSVEDLWAFNEENVARAIYNSKIPIISAVGHEIDYTISDFVSDLRAATPSAAAEVVIRRKEEIVAGIENNLNFIRNYISDKIEDYQQRADERRYNLSVAFRHHFEISQHRFQNLSNKINLLNPQILVIQNIKQIEHFKKMLVIKIEHILHAQKELVASYTHRLSALNPLSVLSRGFSLSTILDTGKLIRDAKEARPGDRVKTKLCKGSFISKVETVQIEKAKRKR